MKLKWALILPLAVIGLVSVEGHADSAFICTKDADSVLGSIQFGSFFHPAQNVKKTPIPSTGGFLFEGPNGTRVVVSPGSQSVSSTASLGTFVYQTRTFDSACKLKSRDDSYMSPLGMSGTHADQEACDRNRALMGLSNISPPLSNPNLFAPCMDFPPRSQGSQNSQPPATEEPSGAQH